MPLDQQFWLASIYLSAKVQRRELATFQGPPLSLAQLAKHLPGYIPVGAVTFNCWYDDVQAAIVTELRDSGAPEPLTHWLEPRTLSDMALLAQGASIAPVTERMARHLAADFDGHQSFDCSL